MRYIANIFSLILFQLLLFWNTSAVHPENGTYSYGPQPPEIELIMGKEKNIENRKNIIDIINYIDNTYGNLFEKVQNGEPITIFFDPAHGKLDSGVWESEISGRMSCTGLPEEYYSIMISRKIYKKLFDNRLISIKSTDDFLSVMRGESEFYRNIPFTKTIELARRDHALIIISEHLNNISSLRKASGMINLSGIHITLDEAGNKYLCDIKGVHQGFLTLYNKYDITGLSENIAGKLKGNLVAQGMFPNSWDFGTVADDRFSYFYDFPISVIFESGFISNPAEEERLKEPDYQEIIAESQYRAIIESIRDTFHIDISDDDDPEKCGDNKDHVNQIKLSRIAFYYIQRGEADRALSTLNTILDICKNLEYKYDIKPYKEIIDTLQKSEGYFKKGFTYLNLKKWWLARQNFLNAWRGVKNTPLFSSFTDKYANTLIKHFIRVKELEDAKKAMPEIIPVPKIIKKATLCRPVIFPVSEGQSIENAVKKALSPDPKLEQALTNAFENASVFEKKKIYKYSKTKKRSIYYYKWTKKKIDFVPGIYIVTLDSRLKVKQVRRVWEVPLDYRKYQNQQYLKNSYFASAEKERAL